MHSRRIGRQILGSFVAVVTGWFAALAFLMACMVLRNLQHAHTLTGQQILGYFEMYAFFMACLIVPVWLLVLIPLYILLPSSSILWRSPICTVCGVFAGEIIMFAFYRGDLDRVLMYHYVMAGMVGGVACLTASLTRRQFKMHLTNRCS
jgi:hypothetical protein